MKCFSWGASLYGRTHSCPLCGLPVPISGGQPGLSIISGLLLVIAGALVLVAALATAVLLPLRARLAANPVYKDALAIARSSQEIQHLLGQPIQEGWWAFGEIRPVYGSDFAEWTASIKRPNGLGRLHGVAHRVVYCLQY